MKKPIPKKKSQSLKAKYKEDESDEIDESMEFDESMDLDEEEDK
jgi:hypothetical protein